MIRRTRIETVLLVLAWLGFVLASGPALAAVDSIVLEIPPGDPCKALVDKFPVERIKTPTAFDKIRGKFKDKLSLDFRTYALVACNDVKNSIVEAVEEQIKSIDPVAAAEAEAQRRLSGYANELYAGFLHFVAETAREPLLASLPADQRAAFAPGSPEADQMALVWLNSPDAEITAYVSAYLHSVSKGSGSLPGLGKIFDDYMSGASQEVLDGFGDLMGDAQKRLDRFLDAKNEIVEQDAPYLETMKKYGFSGEWIEKLEGYEKQLRQIDADYNAFEALTIVYTAMSSDKPDQKIRGFFTLIQHFGSVAEESKLPMVSLVGQIIAAYGDVAVQMLDGLDSLETALRTREGYCVGLGAHAGRDPREAALAKLLGQKTGQADIRICPLKPGRKPWEDIFYREQPQDLNQVYFYYDDKFVAGQPGGGGEEAVLAAVKLASAAAQNGFDAYKDKAADIATLAFLYNLPFEDEQGGRGLLALNGEADTAISTISEQIDRIKGRLAPEAAQCSAASVSAEIERQTGLRMASFPHSADLDKLTTLKTIYAAAFAEKHRTFASTIPTGRQQVYERYKNIWQKIRLLSLLQVQGRVVNAERSGDSCTGCAGANITVNIAGGSQIPGCEVGRANESGRFYINVITDSKDLALTINAQAEGGKGEPYRVDMDYLANARLSAELPFVQTLDIRFPLRFTDEDADLAQRLQNAERLAINACNSYRKSVENALGLAGQWRQYQSEVRAQKQQARAAQDPQAALTAMTANFDQALLSITHAETEAAKSCAAAKDSSASWVSSAEERTGLQNKARRHLGNLERAVAELSSARQTSTQIMQQRPGPTISQAAETAGRTYGEQAAQYLLNEPQLRTELVAAERELTSLNAPLRSWATREEDKAKSYVSFHEKALANVAACKVEWFPKADQATGLVKDMGAQQAAPAPVAATGVWDAISEMNDQIARDSTAAEGLLDKARKCVGALAPAAPVAQIIDHSWAARGWVGSQKLTSIQVSGSSVGSVNCNSLGSCVAAVDRAIAAQAAPDDEDFLALGDAISLMVKSMLGFAFSGMQTGLVIEQTGPQGFLLHAPDIALGEDSAVAVAVQRTTGNFYEGVKSQNVVEGSASTFHVTLDLTNRNQIKLSTTMEMITDTDRGKFGFVAVLQPGTVDGPAIKAANEAEIQRRVQSVMNQTQ